MPRIPLLDRNTAPAASAALLDDIQRSTGATPAMFKAVAHSPAALRMMWASFTSLAGGTLPRVLTEKIAVAVADRNRCEYCLAVHHAMGRKAGATADEMRLAQAGDDADAASRVALQAALQLVEQRGRLDAATLASLQHAGYSDAQVVELIAHVALNLFANYVNVALAVPPDFPAVPLRNALAEAAGRTIR